MVKRERIALVCENTNECYYIMHQLWNDGKTVVLLDSALPTGTIIELLEKVKCNEVIVPDIELSLESELTGVGISTLFYHEIRDSAFQIQISNINIESKVIIFSSGTTSLAKAVVLPVTTLVRATKKLAKYFAANVDGTAYIQLPLSHIFAFGSAMTFMFQNRQYEFGSLMKEKKQLEELKPAIYVSVPSIIEKRLFEHSSIKHYLCGGAVCSETLEKKIRSEGKTIQNCYGSSEVTIAAISAADGPVNKLFPVENCWFDLCEDGTWICSDTLMEGYLGQEELTQKVLREGRFFVSDIIQDNQDGTYSVLGRCDTVVALNNGIKIELEAMDALAKQLVDECDACILYIDGKLVLTIEYPISDIQNRINKFNEEQPYYSRIADYKIIGRSFPRTNSGKLKRNELEEMVKRN